MKAMIQIQETASSTFVPLPPASVKTTKSGDTEAIRLLTERKISEHLMISRRQLYNWRMEGLIPYIKLGKAVRFRLSDVEAMLATMTIQNEPTQPTQP